MPFTHCQIVVLISGNGSNLQALIDASIAANYKIKAVISNRPDVQGLERAKAAGIATEVVDHNDYASRDEFDLALMKSIDGHEPDLVVLAGFMRILGSEFVRHYLGRLLNIHPSLLPKYPGMHTHQRALDAGDKEHGVSVHFVTEEMDGGPVIAQDRITINQDDSAKSLAARVLEKEHILYPKVVSWFAAGRLKMSNNNALLDGDPLPPTGVQVHPE